MNNHDLIICVDESAVGCTVETLLRKKNGFSRTLVRKLKREGGVRLNGLPVIMGERVEAGDVLEVVMPPEKQEGITPEKFPLEIIYEDRDVLLVNKPAGMLVHPVGPERRGTLANAVLYHWLEQGKQSLFRPVYRLDRDTTGVMLVAGGHYAAQQLAGQLEVGRLHRRYLAVVWGQPPASGTVNLPLALKPDCGSLWAVTPGGKYAVTHFQIAEKLRGAALLSLELETGRTHQIRVHMSHLGHPLLGDVRYGGDVSLIKRQALHAASVGFFHPRTGEPVIFKSPLPTDMKELVLRLRKPERETGC